MFYEQKKTEAWWTEYWIEYLAATMKLLNWRFGGHHEIVIELKISWPLPNYYWIENLAATMKLLNWNFHGHRQIIIELKISWPQPNYYWIEDYIP